MVAGDIIAALAARKKAFKTTYGCVAAILAEGELATPHIGNVGVDVDFAQIINPGEDYQDVVEKIVADKRGSRSPWLLIWSTRFFIDHHWIEEWLVSFMRDHFAAERFESVYFIHSVPAEKWIFDANLTIHRIKGPYEVAPTRVG